MAGESDASSVIRESSRTETFSAYNASGSLESRTVATTSANGLTRTVNADTNGDGTIDQSQITVITPNADGSTTQATTDYYANGSVKDSVTTTTSANGRNVARGSPSQSRSLSSRRMPPARQ